MASCSACKKVKSDVSGSTSGFHFCFFFFTCLQLIGFDQVLFEGTYYQREIRILKMAVYRLERNSCQKFFNMVMIIIIRALTSTTTAKNFIKDGEPYQPFITEYLQ